MTHQPVFCKKRFSIAVLRNTFILILLKILLIQAQKCFLRKNVSFCKIAVSSLSNLFLEFQAIFWLMEMHLVQGHDWTGQHDQVSVQNRALTLFSSVWLSVLNVSIETLSWNDQVRRVVILPCYCPILRIKRFKPETFTNATVKGCKWSNGWVLISVALFDWADYCCLHLGREDKTAKGGMRKGMDGH